MRSVFRKSAVERIASPEQLDRMLRITTPFSWVGILAAATITAAILIWSVLGSIPSTVSTRGFLVTPYNTNTIFSTMPGTVSSVLVETGESVQTGMALMEIISVTGEPVSIVSNQDGIVSSILTEVGSSIPSHAELLRLSPETGYRTIILCYVEPLVAGQLHPESKAVVSSHLADSDAHQRRNAFVINVDQFPATTQAMIEVLGPDKAQTLDESMPLVAVTCAFEEENSIEEEFGGVLKANGYNFSDKQTKGMRTGEEVNVRLILDESTPLEKVFPALRGD